MNLDTAIAAEKTLPQPRPQPQARRADSLGWRLVKIIASLRLTVVLFVLSLVLVFFGTWAQVDQGIWTVVNRYFRSLVVWIPLKVFVLHAEWLKPAMEEYWERIALPFPGGWLIGTVMLI